MITRHFATIGQRQVHYRRVGAGPPVLILHQSPKNSAEQAPLMRRIAEAGCTAIAPDTPGFGQSDPLPHLADSAIDSFATGVADFMDAIGVARAPVYGFHTGASIATRLAALRPERVSLLIANGVLVLDEADRADFLARYLPPFEIRWDGSHLVWAWQRMRDQSIFFPWHRRTGASRMVRAPSAPEIIHDNVMDLFAAGPAYAQGYRAALAFDGRPDMARLETPALYLAIETDPLTAGLTAWPTLPSHAQVVRTRTIEESWDVAARALAQASGGHIGAASGARGRDGDWTNDVVIADGCNVHVRLSSSGQGRPIALIHDVGGSGGEWLAHAHALRGRRPIAIIDLPGHGRSDAGADAVAAVAGALAALGMTDADVFALGWSGGLSAAPRWRAVEPPSAATRAADPAAFVPDLATDPDGAHLLRAWRFVRDRRLFDPWHRPDANGILPGDPDLACEDLHRAAVDALTARGSMRALIDAAAPGLEARADAALTRGAAIRQAVTTE